MQFSATNRRSENQVLTSSDILEFRSTWRIHQRGLLNPPWWSAAYLVAPLAPRPLRPRASTTRWEVPVGNFVYRYIKTPSANGSRGKRRGTKQDGVCIESCGGRGTGRGISRDRQDTPPQDVVRDLCSDHASPALVPLSMVSSRTTTLICLYSRCYHAEFAWSYRSFERAISDCVSRPSCR